MFKLTVDTCVWLDLAKDHRQHHLISVLGDMQRNALVSLLTPECVIAEFKRNKGRIAQEAVRSVRTQIQVVKGVVDAASRNPAEAERVKKFLDDVGQKAPLLGGAAESILQKIEDLLAAGEIVRASPAIMVRAAQRALDGRAPVHRGKNSVADAVILESYCQCVSESRAKGVRFGFVTHNKHDFSAEGGNHKHPHSDICDSFSKVKSLYFTSLRDALGRADPTYLADAMLDYSFDQEPRGLQELLAAEELLYHQVWYNRHWNRRIAIEEGKIRLVSHEEWQRMPDRSGVIVDDIWKGALEAAKGTERFYGKKNLGPWTDFEWGMVNGKLSALRWVMGEEWDMLDS